MDRTKRSEYELLKNEHSPEEKLDSVTPLKFRGEEMKLLEEIKYLGVTIILANSYFILMLYKMCLRCYLLSQ